MKESDSVRVVVFVPLSHTDIVRDVVARAGAGKIGSYSHCSFSSRGVGRFLPEKNANPTIGEVGKLEEVEEERIEFICPKDCLDTVIESIKTAHPYEEVAMDIYPLLEK
jgi:hypothetical protein